MNLGYSLFEKVTVEVKSGTFADGFGSRPHSIVAHNWDYKDYNLAIDQHLIRSLMINIHKMTFRQVSKFTSKYFMK